jgi:hypothetical protein
MDSQLPTTISTRRLPLADKVGYLGLLVFLVALGIQFGYRRGAKDARAADADNFYPA